MSRNLAQRIAFAAVAIPLALLALWLGGWVLAVLLGALGTLGAREVYELAGRQRLRPLGLPGLAGAALIPLVVYGALAREVAAGAVLFAGAGWIMLTLALALWTRAPADAPLAAVSVTVFGALYAAGLPAFLLVIRHPSGSALDREALTWLAALPLAATWIGDTLAMAGGRLFGGPKLAPVLSPSKTWAGALTGGLGTVLAAVLLGRVGGVQLGVLQLVTWGGVVAVAGQVGDVAESLFKRAAGVKDSSNLIPGHGGVLDRLDSLYFAIPAGAALFACFGMP